MNFGKQVGLALLLTVPLSAAAQSAVPLSGLIERTGRFTSLAAPTSGTVVVFRSQDGRTHLLLHRFKAQASSRLQVWLYKGTPRRGDRNPGPTGSALQVGGLTAFKGDFEFVLPSGVDMSAGFRSVVIWNSEERTALGVAPLE